MGINFLDDSFPLRMGLKPDSCLIGDELSGSCPIKDESESALRRKVVVLFSSGGFSS